MTNIDHANADIVRSDLKQIIIDAVGEAGSYDLENQLDAMTTNELWATAAGYDLL